MFVAGLCAAALAIAPAPLANAELQSQAPAPPGASEVEPVVVTARSPRLWKLVRGRSTVWVLGAVEPLPKGLVWNSAPLAKLIQGANRVLLPPEGSGGAFDALGALAHSRLSGGAKLDAVLPAALDANYKTTLRKLGRDPDVARRDKPAWAALFLEIDFVRSKGVDLSEPSRTAARIAHQAHVKVQRIATYQAGSILRELVDLPEAEGEAALADASEGVAFGLSHVAAAGHAWATGDLKAVRTNISPEETPLIVFLHTPTGRILGARAIDDTTAALRSALADPGVTVAILRLTDLVEDGGALDRLRRDGVLVTEPALQ